MEDSTKNTEAAQSNSPEVSAPVAGTNAPQNTNQSVWYVLVFLIVLVTGLVIWFFMERAGHVSTNVFSGVTSYLSQGESVARVNGESISTRDFESTLTQLTANVTNQGVDISDPMVVADLREQAVESLVTTELLRQKAVAEGIEVTEAQVEARYQEIVNNIGGEEVLRTRMSELAVTEDMLRRDITNDILIQTHLEATIDTENVDVSDEEVTELYNQAGGVEAGLPPLEELREQVVAQVRFQKEQALVAEYVETLRQDATIEILI